MSCFKNLFTCSCQENDGIEIRLRFIEEKLKTILGDLVDNRMDIKRLEDKINIQMPILSAKIDNISSVLLANNSLTKLK